MNLSIKNAPEDAENVLGRLRARVAKDVLGEVRRLRLSTSSEAVAIARADRDGR